jgi:preprotein translocase subunit SecD
MVIGPRGRRPRFADFSPSGIKSTLAQNIHLGLDLKGGTHLVMRVKVEDYLRRLTEDSATAAQNAAKDAGFDAKEARADVSGNSYRVILQIGDPSKAKDIREAVEKKVDLSDRAGWSFSSSGDTLSWSLNGATQVALGESATDQAMRIIDSRVNALGVVESTLARHGGQNSHQILLQMPGIQDTEHVKLLLAGQSHLELVHIISPPSPAPSQNYATKEEAIASLNSGGAIPANRRVLPYSERAELASQAANPNAAPPKKWVVVESPAIIDGAELRSAAANPGRAGGDEYEIDFALKKTGADKFGNWTGANINEYMGVVLTD